MRLAFQVEVRVIASRVGVSNPMLRIDAYRPKARQVDHHPVVAQRVPGDIVTSASDCDRQVVIAGEAHRMHHVTGAQRLHDDARPFVDHPVEDAAGNVVPLIAGPEDAAMDARRQGAEGLLARYRCHSTLPISSHPTLPLGGGRPRVDVWGRVYYAT